MYTIAQAARYLLASPSFVRKLTKLGTLRYIDIGSGSRRTVRITEASLREFIEAR